MLSKPSRWSFNGILYFNTSNNSQYFLPYFLYRHLRLDEAKIMSKIIQNFNEEINREMGVWKIVDIELPFTQ